MISTAYILLGSNMGNKIRLLQEASALIDGLAGKIIQYSSYYESAPWGFEAEERFINQVVTIQTFLSPEKLLQTTQSIERALGKCSKQQGCFVSLAMTSSRQYSSRYIDIDILFYDEMVISTSELTIPHPLLQERLFTLLPLAEIVREFVHPIFKKTIAALLKECSDTGMVRKMFVG
ncbi:MAG: 2-amino-4-hydroxy-6-hydroxymethyldihydropteridine diphosphokinase [Prevotellaceae bacterium]|jgi:2-amino-4-hydroxy-6-hydroxymethyldihydropteridine diphosphokinase|nr:2-amino-4-hydroxy-6-hydroxymethyldihydropteridine diphosphokinase [Prevotellaceae bacterium]